MLNTGKRESIRKYFYGTKGPIVLGTIGTAIAAIIGLFTSMGSMLTLCGITIVVALIWGIIERFGMNKAAEGEYDAYIKEDLAKFSERAIKRLGLISEQVSIIDPIKVVGPYYDFKIEGIDVKSTSTFFTVIKVILKIVFCVPYLIYIGIKAIKGQHVPQLIFKYGTDEKVRYSLVRGHIFLFSETQVYVYRVSYDICTGEIFEESTSEYFYRDIDCVITGEEHRKIMSKKKVVDKTFEYFKLVVTSGTSTHAYADVETSILATQVMGMRALIRNKKEEITG